jgi:hypothetical protein
MKRNNGHARGGSRSFFRHSGQPEAGEQGSLGQSAELRRLQPSCSGRRLQAGNTRIAIAEPARFA